jgi:ArsR family transcriptional regulator, arsenate/arsenite/antimonite-responsive transcriptional repressor / arsenate reductase (thioredoxin)
MESLTHLAPIHQTGLGDLVDAQHVHGRDDTAPSKRRSVPVIHKSHLIDIARLGTVSEMQSTVAAGPDIDDPPSFVRLASHPLRWRLLRELVLSDRAVRELMLLVDEPQSLVSYHLRLLREGGLVTSRRSSADGRDSYYAIDLDACREALQSAGGALHPSLRLAHESAERQRGRSPRRRQRVLFLCTGNSARSQIAEALLARMSGGTIHAVSAGSHPKQLHLNAIRVLRKRGVDISQNRAKHLDEFRSDRFDTVITLCDRVREVCPDFPARPELVHWSIPDPALEGPTNRASYPAFERTAAELETRIRFRLPLFEHTATQRRSTNVHR